MAEKQYNTQNLAEKKPGKTQEDGGVGRAGFYRHPESGQTAITLYDPLFGDTQSNAFERLGFVRERDAYPEEIKTVPSVLAAAEQKETDSLKGLSARMAALEGVAEQNKSLTEELAKMRAERDALLKDQTEVSGDHAKDAAAAQVAQRTGTEPVNMQTGEQAQPDKPVEKQNETELKATAAAEGVDLSEADTVKKKKAAILAAREAKEKEGEK